AGGQERPDVLYEEREVGGFGLVEGDFVVEVNSVVAVGDGEVGKILCERGAERVVGVDFGEEVGRASDADFDFDSGGVGAGDQVGLEICCGDAERAVSGRCGRHGRVRDVGEPGVWNGRGVVGDGGAFVAIVIVGQHTRCSGMEGGGKG